MKESFPETDLFKALSDPNRLKILQRLCGCADAQSVSEMSQCCDIDLSVVSRHLSRLKSAGAVSAEREGRHTLYRANAARLASTFRQLADALETSACQCAAEPKPEQPDE